MKTFYAQNLASSDVEPMPCNPWDTTHNGYPSHVKTKDDYDKWVRDKATEHCFFSAFEGVNPHRRISLENPARWMHGLVADYDAKLDPNFSLQEILDRCNPEALPAAVSRTFSGNARLVWEFDKPVLVDCPEATKALMKEIAKKFKVAALLPGLDECTFRNNQLFEIGHSWVPVPGNPSVSETVLGDLLVKACERVDWNKVANSDLEIPIEKIADEVEARWPGRWQGEFKVGSRGPTFWIDDGIDRIGCQVTENGMVCYTDRAGKSFLPWDEILGKAFVDKYRQEVIGKAVAEFYYDGKSFWFRNGQDRWYDAKVEDVSRALRVHGIKTASKSGASQMDRVIYTIQSQRRVDAAVPILFTDNELVDIGNDRFLNTNYRKPILPADSGDPSLWPFIHKWVFGIFDDEQRPYFLAWHQRFYRGAIEGVPTQGQVLVIAGEAGQGKTLLNWRVLGASVGGFADATAYLQGRTSFNKTMAEHPLWVIDDPQGMIDYDKHRQFGEAIKAHVANPRVSYHPKFKDSIEISWHGRMVMTCNTDPQSLSVLPPLENNIGDKIMLFKLTDYQHEFLTNEETEAIIARELPHYLRWLLDWTPPDEVLWHENPRYGIRPYHQPDMVATAVEDSPATKLEEVLDRWAASMRREGVKGQTQWQGSVTDLYSSLMGVDEGALKPLISRYTPVRLGRELRTLSQRGGSRIIKHHKPKNKSVYVVNIAEHAAD
jgi:hypothetical protein